jgi:hypothetical protein
VAISCGQAEKLHLDLNDDIAIYTSIMVLGRERRALGLIPALRSALPANFGLRVPMTFYDMVFFKAAPTFGQA